jgi:membrane protease YdiL (CAAX protease family)
MLRKEVSMPAKSPNVLSRFPLWSFFLLTFALNIVVTVTQLYILKIPQTKPIAILQVLTPTLSAVILSYLLGGWNEVRKLFSGFTRWRVHWFWYLAAFMMTGFPLLIAIVYILLGNPIQGMNPDATVVSLLGLLGFTLLSGPLTEEAGWRGFALPRLQQRYSALASSLILGVLWAAWHIPFYFEPGYAANGMPLPIFMVVVTALAILFTWIYNNSGGSLLLTMLAHFFFNFSSAFLVQEFGLLPPMLLYIGGGGLMLMLIVWVVIYFGPKRLSRKPEAELPFATQTRLEAAGAYEYSH